MLANLNVAKTRNLIVPIEIAHGHATESHFSVYLYQRMDHVLHLMLGPAAAGRGMFCYHCPPALHPTGPHPPRLPALDYPFAPTHPLIAGDELMNVMQHHSQHHGGKLSQQKPLRKGLKWFALLYTVTDLLMHEKSPTEN
uniref:Uncharacterized protein n=1 Tax=Lutzomyia longipalpis TaxID=7200 RepID=A0A1B0GHZ0_LUTLO